MLGKFVRRQPFGILRAWSSELEAQAARSNRFYMTSYAPSKRRLPLLFCCCFLPCSERRWKVPDFQTGYFPCRTLDEYIRLVSCTGRAPVLEMVGWEKARVSWRLGAVLPTVAELQIKQTRALRAEHSWGTLLSVLFPLRHKHVLWRQLYPSLPAYLTRCRNL
jgi:hypothetical protein